MTPDITEMKPFWMVYGLGQGAPTYQHGTEAAALREAERLAEVRPGVTFVVLEATQAVRTRRLDYFDLRTAPHTDGQRPRHNDSEDNIPF
ncbi:hypothetical protein [Methylorubrum extorquens]|uniref:DUF2188 domain-containing protein n=1 Tax=Methylorubrum extorquens (strain CM4 / NCIMB 13688) TaxID=440085 RepID=B7KSX3_METC4|nr:hypothetical protein [Methylorubrum extorquens]ACK82475.1 hypothetical protein Mchl_1611 [Methylorubrum extorquens CM4]